MRFTTDRQPLHFRGSEPIPGYLKQHRVLDSDSSPDISSLNYQREERGAEARD